MGIREKINQNPAVGAGLAGAVLILSVAYIVWRATGGGDGAPSISAKGFYTVDDGKTWFTDYIYKSTPFDHDGKPAYGAVVLKCDDKPFVAYVSRLSENFRKEARALEAKGKDADFGLRFESLLQQGLEVRKPGEKLWHKLDSPAGLRLIENSQKCPDGTPAEPVLP